MRTSMWTSLVMRRRLRVASWDEGKGIAIRLGRNRGWRIVVGIYGKDDR